MKIVFIYIFLLFSSLSAGEVEIWYETFGKKEEPAVLLISGATAQGSMWPSEFCQKLAGKGFFVIRYDHRDTGRSTHIDYETEPYDLLDMAKDASELLDKLAVKRAHLVGSSLGSAIAQILSVHYPDKVSSMTLMATTADSRPLHLALQGLPAEEGTLPPPRQECYRERLHNHLRASIRSEELIRQVPHKVKVPTTIYIGSDDPLFSPEHGKALQKAIAGSQAIYVEGMGHGPNRYFDLLLEDIHIPVPL
jgi:pimeloyl-ACP methyl ester carboxylesterase